ncbi:MAG TPA: hypothetical protein PLO61_09970 [Fimbriimonadaceae bacterium]|nr:hypothetical protein [Fimbriimonadaceae bacterium]HRJ33928.1 hypothetical protein [Fimbriimonadaceae bacterium]
MKKKLGWIVGFLVLGGLSLAYFAFRQLGNLDEREKSVFARAAELNVPVREEELPLPNPRPEDNAVSIVAELSKLIKADVATAEAVTQLTDAKRTKPPTAAELKPVAEVLKLAELLEAKKFYRQTFKASTDVLTPVTQVAILRDAALLLSARGEIRCADNDLTGGLQDFSTALHICDLMAQTRTFLMVMQSNNALQSVHMGLRRVAKAFSNSAPALKQIRDACQEPEFPSLRSVFLVSAYDDYSVMMTAEKEARESDEHSKLGRDAFLALIKKSYLDAIEKTCQIVAEADQNQWSERKLMDSLNKRYASRTKGNPEALIPEFEEHFPLVNRGLKQFSRGLAIHRLTVCFLNLLINRAERGKLPSSLAGMGEQARDPYSKGQAFRYFLTKQGGGLYSVGFNGKDDRGAAAPSRATDDVAMSPKFLEIPDDIGLVIPPSLMP